MHVDSSQHVRTHADPLGPWLERYLLSGDEAAMEEVVRRTRPRLVAAARGIVRSEDAEDAVQVAYLSLVRHRGGRLEAPVVPWLLTAVVRTAYRRKALERREAALAERLALPSARFAAFRTDADAEDVDRLRREVARLPARYRDPVVLHSLHGLSIAETGRLLGLPDATVRTRLHRARVLVRGRWSPRLLAGVWALPWWLADGAKNVSSGHVAVTLGGVMKTNAVAITAVALLAAAVGLGVGMLAGGSSDADSRAKRAEKRLGALEGELASLRRELADAQETARSRVALRDAEAPELTGRPATTASLVPAVPVPTAAAEEAPADAGATSAPRVRIPGMEGPLGEIDWGMVGNAVAKLRPELDGLAEARAYDKPLSPEAMGRIVTHSGPLVTAALRFEKNVEGSNANAAYTHPAFMSNAIAATLQAAGQALTEPQMRTLTDLGVRFTEEERARTQGYGPQTFALQKVLEESELRDRFFEAAFAALTPEQRGTLVNPQFRGRVGLDLFSSGLIWQMRSAQVKFENLDELVAGIEQRLVAEMDASLNEAQRADLKQAVGRWLSKWPAASLDEPADPYALGGMPMVSSILMWGHRQLELLQALPRELNLDPAKTEKLRAMETVCVPIRFVGGG